MSTVFRLPAIIGCGALTALAAGCGADPPPPVPPLPFAAEDVKIDGAGIAGAAVTTGVPISVSGRLVAASGDLAGTKLMTVRLMRPRLEASDVLLGGTGQVNYNEDGRFSADLAPLPEVDPGPAVLDVRLRLKDRSVIVVPLGEIEVAGG